MKIYGIYENDEYEECVMIGLAREIAKELGMKRESIHKAIFRGSKIHGKRKKKLYILKEVGDTKDEN